MKDDSATTILDLKQRTAEVEKEIAVLRSIVHGKSEMLDEIATAAGYLLGQQYSAASIITRLRNGDR